MPNNNLPTPAPSRGDEANGVGNPPSDTLNAEGSVQMSEDQLKEILKGIITEHVCQDVDREKVYQYAEARKNELYFRGSQYLYPVLLGGQTADWSVTSGTMGYNQSPDQRDAEYDYVLNVIRGDGRKFIAVLGQRGPNAKAEARRTDDEAAVRRARKADIAAEYLRSCWQPEKIQRHLALSLWKNGTTFAYTPWVANGEKYGTVDVPIIDAQPVEIGEPYYRCVMCGSETPASLAGTPPSCISSTCPELTVSGKGHPFQPQDLNKPPTVDVPNVVGNRTYPKGSVELHLATIFEVTVPFYSRSIADCPWLWYEYEEHEGKLLAAFPDLRDKLGEQEWAGDSSGISAQGRLARDVASSPTGSFISPRKNRWLYSRFWLRPAMFEMVGNDEIRTQLKKLYPQGVKVTLVQGEVAAMDAERLDDVWAMCKPDVSEYIFADAICKDYMSIQDMINDLYNLVAETMERAIPYLIADPMVLDVLQLSKQRGKPGQIIPAKAGVGARLNDSIIKAPTATVDPEVFQWMEKIHEAGREIVGVLPAIFGGGEPASTARAAELQRNQALQQLNTVWNEMRDFWSGAYFNAVRQLASHCLPDGSNLGNFEAVDADFSDLLGGGYFFTTEEAIPMTWGQKRDLVMFLLQGGPEAWTLFGLQHPLNIAKVHDTLGMPDWKITDLDARDKVLSNIKALLEGQPQPGQNPGEMVPSIPPDVFEDDHIFVASVIKEWCQTEDARAIRDMNPSGYANVIAYGQASLQLSGPPGPSAPPGPPQPGGPPSGGGPGGGPPGPDMPGAPSGNALPPPPGSQIGGAPPSAAPGGPAAPPTGPGQ
jgi:hypothetical protein